MDVADEATLAAVAAHAAAAGCVATVMRRRGTGADVLVRRSAGVQAELRVAVIGCAQRHAAARRGVVPPPGARVRRLPLD